MDERVAIIRRSRSNPLEESDAEIRSAHQWQDREQPCPLPEGGDSKLSSVGPAYGVNTRLCPCKVLKRTRFAGHGQRGPGSCQFLELCLVLDETPGQLFAGNALLGVEQVLQRRVQSGWVEVVVAARHRCEVVLNQLTPPANGSFVRYATQCVTGCKSQHRSFPSSNVPLTHAHANNKHGDSVINYRKSQGRLLGAAVTLRRQAAKTAAAREEQNLLPVGSFVLLAAECPSRSDAIAFNWHEAAARLFRMDVAVRTQQAGSQTHCPYLPRRCKHRFCLHAVR